MTARSLCLFLLASLLFAGCSSPEMELDVAELGDEVSALDDRVGDVEGDQHVDIGPLGERMDAFEQSATTSHEDLESQIGALEGLLEVVQLALVEAQALAELARSVAADALAGLADAVATHEADHLAHEVRLMDLEADVAAILLNTDALGSDVAVLDGRVTANEAGIAALDVGVDALGSEVGLLDERATANEAEVAALDAVIEDLPHQELVFETEKTQLSVGPAVRGQWMPLPVPSGFEDAVALYLEIEMTTVGPQQGDDFEFFVRELDGDWPHVCQFVQTNSSPGGHDHHACHVWLPVSGEGVVEYRIGSMNPGTSIESWDVDILGAVYESGS